MTSAPITSRRALAGGRWRAIVAPVVFGLAVLVLWQAMVTILAIKPFVLPGPLDIGEQFAASLGPVWAAMLITAANAFVGLVVGTIFGIVAAVLSAVFKVIDRMSAPVVTAAAVIPIVSLAPVLYTMFGASVQTARQLVAALAVFIPVYFNTLRGLRNVRPVHRDLLRAYAATRWQATTTVTLPGALPFLLTGIRIASSLAVISALVAEYFGGPVGGLGKAITSAVSSSNYALAWAFVLGSIITGLIFYLATLGIERLATRHRS
jgi:NitT/TauT family transport system permease protein